MDEMEELCSQINEELASELSNMTNMSYIEFSKYMPLFKESGSKELDPEDYNDLCLEWSKRVSLYDKVTIIDPHREEDNVIATLPPAFTRISEINKAGRGMGRVADYFADTLIRDTRFNGEMNKSLALITAVMQKAQLAEIDEKRESVKSYIELRSAIDGGPKVEESPDTEDTDDFVWE